MARKIFTEVTDTVIVEQCLQVTCDEELIQNYIAKKAEYDALEKVVKKLGDEVKRIMKERDMKTTDYNGYRVVRSEYQRVTWNEDALLEKVKGFNKPELICTVEKVDVPKLEQAIMDEEVDINEIKECQKTTDVVTLKVNKIKEVKE